eukprot:10170992-Ditylum_brightwellii.AAC.1
MNNFMTPIIGWYAVYCSSIGTQSLVMGFNDGNPEIIGILDKDKDCMCRNLVIGLDSNEKISLKHDMRSKWVEVEYASRNTLPYI